MTQPDQSTSSGEIDPGHDAQIHLVVFVVPDKQILGTSLVGVEVVLGRVETVDLEGGFSAAGVDQFGSEIDDVVVVSSKLLHELVVAEEGGVSGRGEGVETGLWVQPEEQVGVGCVEAPVSDYVQQGVLGEDEAVFKRDGVDCVLEIVRTALPGPLVVAVGPVSNQLVELCVGPV